MATCYIVCVQYTQVYTYANSPLFGTSATVLEPQNLSCIASSAGEVNQTTVRDNRLDCVTSERKKLQSDTKLDMKYTNRFLAYSGIGAFYGHGGQISTTAEDGVSASARMMEQVRSKVLFIHRIFFAFNICALYA